ncbi:MAG: HAMP domain-containing histidine kinase [Sphingomonas sp.]|nr:HAMP domain-containing histidine kinase [Sphingomonas sp.]
MPEPVRRTVLRTVILYIAIFGMTSLALGEGAFLYARHELARRLDARIAERMDRLGQTYAAGGQAGLLRAIDAFTDHGARTLGYVLTDARGQRVRRLGDVPRLAPGWGVTTFEDEDEGVTDPARTFTRRLPDGSTLTIVADRDYIEQYDTVTTGFLFAAIALLFLVAAAGALSLERKVRSRIEGLNQTARAIFEGDLDQRVPISPAHDEFDAIAGTVNAMLDRLNWTLQEVRRVSTYIAHDLRAPIVRLRDHLQRSSRADRGPVDIEAVERCEDIIRLFSVILRIGEIDCAMIAGTAAEFDLSELVAELSDAHVAVAEDLGRSLTHAIAPDIAMSGDRDLIAQLLVNLIDNALRHTPAGAHVAVRLTSNGTEACLAVADDGAGLPERERRQLGTLRPRAGDGTMREGVGLKLAQAIATSHQGHLTLHDNQPGLRVEVSLPLHLARRGGTG